MNNYSISKGLTSRLGEHARKSLFFVFILIFVISTISFSATAFISNMNLTSENEETLFAYAEESEEPDFGFATVIGGTNYSFALTDEGELFSWGRNNIGQLGIGIEPDQYLPVRVADYAPAIEGVVFKKIVAALNTSPHVIALDADGEIWTWGNNYDGRLGYGVVASPDVNSYYKPQRVADFISTLSDIRFKDVTVTTNSTYAISEDGQIYSWGGNTWGQLGVGDKQPVNMGRNFSPLKISNYNPSLTGVSFNKIIGGNALNFVVAIDDNGQPWTWGSNVNGSLGLGDMQATNPISGHRNHSPSRVADYSPQIASLRFVDGITANGSVILITDNGDLWGWGTLGVNVAGTLGLGYHSEELSPINISEIQGRKYKTIGNKVWGIDENDVLWGWGYETSGLLANGVDTTSYTHTPTNIIDSNSHISDVAFKLLGYGLSHSMAVSNTGDLYVSGKNGNGHLGLGHNESLPSNNYLNYVGNLLKPRITAAQVDNISLQTDSIITNVAIDSTSFSINFSAAMATNSGNITDTGLMGTATLTKQGETENLLALEGMDSKHIWNEKAKELTLEINESLEYSTTYTLTLSGYEKHLFPGQASGTYTFTTQADPTGPAPTDPTDPDDGDNNGENGGNGNNGTDGSGNVNNGSENNGNGIDGNSSNNSDNSGNGGNIATLDSDRQGAFRPFSPRNDGQGGDSTDGTVGQTEATTKAPATITDTQTPLSSGNGTGNWSLLSLLLGIASVIVSLMFLLIRRKKDDDDDTYGYGAVEAASCRPCETDDSAERTERNEGAHNGQGSYSTNGQGRTEWSSEYSENSSKHGLALKLIAVLVGLLPIALFLILDDLTSQMTFINRWTVFVAIAFVVHMVITVVAKVRQDKNEEETYTI